MHTSRVLHVSTTYASRSHLRDRGIVRVTDIAHMYTCAAQGAYDLDCDMFVAFDRVTKSYIIAKSKTLLLSAMSGKSRRYAVTRITRRSRTDAIIEVQELTLTHHPRTGKLRIERDGAYLKHGRLDGVEVSS